MGVQLGLMPPFSPMEAKVQAELPHGDAWQYEPKWDGFRAVVFKDGDEVVVHSRNAKPLTRYFPELVPAMQKIKPKRVVLDGEIVIFTGFGTDFEAMQLRIHPAASRVNMLAGEQPSTFIAFDLLADGDESMLDKPLAEWSDPRIVQVPRGISRHVVRFVRAHNQIFAFKEATE